MPSRFLKGENIQIEDGFDRFIEPRRCQRPRIVAQSVGSIRGNNAIRQSQTWGDRKWGHFIRARGEGLSTSKRTSQSKA